MIAGRASGLGVNRAHRPPLRAITDPCIGPVPDRDSRRRPEGRLGGPRRALGPARACRETCEGTPMPLPPWGSLGAAAHRRRA